MISPDTIASVKDRADLESLVRESVTLRRVGNALVGLCPFHSERTPSFTVNVVRQFYYCHGCHAHGGPVDFVMGTQGLTFPEAITDLAQRLGIDVETGTAQDKHEADRARREAKDLHDVNAAAAAFFYGCLWGGDNFATAKGNVLAFEELDGRGLTVRPDDEGPAAAALAAFRIGYAPASWRGLTSYLERQKCSLESAERVGLIVKLGDRYVDRFRHRLMFPVVDALGRVVAFSGRTLPEPDARYRDAPDFTTFRKDRESGKTIPPAKYINSPESPIYTKGAALFGLWQAKDAIREKGEALMVEGNFDVLSLHARGIRHAIAPLGTAFTEAQAKLLHRFTGAVVLGFDGDKAGRKATWESRKVVRAGRLDARALVLPEGSDPDSFVRAKGAQALLDLAARAIGLREHLLRWLLANGERNDEASRMKRVKAAIDLLGEEGDSSMLRVYADRLSSQYVVDGRSPQSLGGLLRDLELSFLKTKVAPTEALPPPPDAVAFAVLGAVLDVPSIASRPQAEAVLSALNSDTSIAVAAAQERSVETLLARTPASLRPHVEARLAAPLYAKEEPALAALLANGARLVERASLAAERETREDLANAEALGEHAEVDRLLGVLTAMVRARQARQR